METANKGEDEADAKKRRAALQSKVAGALALGCVGSFLLFLVLLMVGNWLKSQSLPRAQPVETPAPLNVDEARAAVTVLCEHAVKDRLKSPRSADFPFAHSTQVVSAGANAFRLASYVDAQNAFGATMRSPFVCEARWKGGNQNDPQTWEVVRVDLQEP